MGVRGATLSGGVDPRGARTYQEGEASGARPRAGIPGKWSAQEGRGSGARKGTSADPRSPQCRAAASAAFAEVERRLRAGREARGALRAELGACTSLDRAEDQAELLGALQALVGGTVQYDAQAGAPLSVRRLCGLLLEGRSNRSLSAPYHGLRRAVQVSGPERGLVRGRRVSRQRVPAPLPDLGPA